MICAAGLDIILLLYISLLGSAASYGVFFYNASKGNLTALSSLTFLTPMFAAGCGYLFLGEGLTPLQLGGATVTLGAVALLNSGQSSTWESEYDHCFNRKCVYRMRLVCELAYSSSEVRGSVSAAAAIVHSWSHHSGALANAKYTCHFAVSRGSRWLLVVCPGSGCELCSSACWTKAFWITLFRSVTYARSV